MIRTALNIFGLTALLAGAPQASAQTDTARSPPATRITAEEFGALPYIANPQISPDGKKIVAKGIVNGKSVLLLFDLSSEPTKTRVIGKPEHRDIVWARWAGNDRVLLSIGGRTVIYGMEVYTTQLTAMNLATGAYDRVGLKETQGIYGDDVIHIDPAGRFILLAVQRTLTNYPQVERIDLATGTTQTVVTPQRDVWNWFADPSGVVRAGVGAKGRRWWLLFRDGEGQPFEKVVRRSAKADNEDSEIERFIPLNGTNQGYAIANGPTGRYGVYRYDFGTDTLGAPLFEHPEVDIDDFDLSEDGKSVVSVSYTDDRARVKWFDADMQTLQAKLERALPGNIVRVTSASRDRQTMLVWSGGASDPGGYFLYDKPKRTLRPLFKPFDSLAGKTFAAVDPVEYRARDGTAIPAYLTLPAGREAKALPLIVMPHGGPFYRDSWSFDSWAQFLANRGYAVLQPNFRGSTGYGRAFVEKGMGQWGRGMQDDIDDGVRWLVEQGKADPKRVCIMGGSFGGYAAMWAAARNPEIYRCAISWAGISDVGAMIRYDRKLFAATRYYRDWRERVRGEEDFDLKTVSPIYALDRIAIPLLIGHGEKDGTVPVAQSAKLRDALQKAGKPHEYVVYPDEGHSFTKPENAADFLKRADAFLAKHNPA